MQRKGISLRLYDLTLLKLIPLRYTHPQIALKRVEFNQADHACTGRSTGRKICARHLVSGLVVVVTGRPV